MIARLRGRLLVRDTDRVEVETSGGVVYEASIPLTVFQRLPEVGEAIELLTVQVVRDDAITLYGVLEEAQRTLFRRLMGASGVGAKLAIAMLGEYTVGRLARALAEKDVAALVQVSGVGKKTAERLVVELSDRVADLATDADPSGQVPSRTREAVSALVSLGFSFADADSAVRAVLDDEAVSDTQELIRRALSKG